MLKYLIALSPAVLAPEGQGRKYCIPYGVSYCPEDLKTPIQLWEGSGWESGVHL